QVARPIRDFTDSLLAWATHDWGTMIAYSLAFYAIVIGFFLIALHLMMTIIEFNLAVMAGTVLIPWGVFPALAFLGESSLSWIIGGLVKVLVTAALVSMALPLFARVVFTPSSGGDPTFYSATLCGLVSLLFAILAWVIPGRAGAIASRGVSLALSGSDV